MDAPGILLHTPNSKPRVDGGNYLYLEDIRRLGVNRWCTHELHSRI